MSNLTCDGLKKFLIDNNVPQMYNVVLASDEEGNSFGGISHPDEYISLSFVNRY